MSKKPLADIHTHILPGVDDGPKNTNASFGLLEKEKEQGVSLVVLTPHYVHGRNRYDSKSLRQAYDNFRNEKDVLRLGVRLLLGNEIYYSPSVADALRSGEALPLGDTRSVLLEFNPSAGAGSILEGCRNIYNSGYSVILAHMERYENLTDREIDALLSMDVQFQMNASFVKALCKPIAGRSRRYKQLIKDGCISYVATDVHDTTHRSPSFYAQEIRRHFPEHADAMLYENAARLFGAHE